MPFKKIEPVTKYCVVCNEPFLVCPPGHRLRTPRRPFDAEYCSRECRFRARWRQGTPCKLLSIADAAYIAGFFDGEGSVLLYRRSKNIALRATFANTKRSILEWIQETIGAGNIVTTTHANSKHATSHLLLINSQAALSFLEQVLPYLHIKAEQAQVAIDFQQRLKVPSLKADTTWQFEARERLRILNQRGPQPPDESVPV